MARRSNLLGTQTPLGQAVAGLAQTFLSGPTALERAEGESAISFNEARARKANLEGDTISSRNDARSSLAEAVRNLAEGERLPAGMFGSTGVYLSEDPSDLANAALLYGGMTQRVGSPELDGLMVGAGSNYQNTATGNREAAIADRQTALAKIAATPLTESQRRGLAFAALPAETQAVAVGPTFTEARGHFTAENFDNLGDLDPMQREVLGATPSNGITVSPDGTVQIGGSSLGTAARNTLDDNAVVGNELGGLLEDLEARLDVDIKRTQAGGISSYGVGGAVAGSDAVGYAAQIADMALPEASAYLESQGVDPATRERILADRAAAGTVTSQIGRFIANGMNNDRFSDADRRAAEGIFNAVSGARTAPEIKAQVRAFRELLGSSAQRNAAIRKNGLPNPGGLGDAAVPQTAPEQGPTVEQYVRGADGVLRRAQ